MTKCSVKQVWAPNGSASILYRDAKKKLKDPQQALNLWASINTKEFKSVFGDWKSEDFMGELDKNGEPRLEDVLNPQYAIEADALIQAEKFAEEYSEAAERMENYRAPMRDTLTRKIAQLERYKGKTGRMKMGLEKLKKSLKRLDMRSATLQFSATAAKQIDYADNMLNKELAKKEPNVHMLTKYKNYLEAFDIMDTIAAEVRTSELMSEGMQEDLDNVAKLTQRKNAAKQKYWNYMKNEVANKLSKLSNKEDAASVKKLLEEAPFDVTGWQKTMLYAGDSKDTTVQLIAKMINEQQQKTRHTSIEFTKTLSDKVDAIVAERPEYKGSPEKLYAPMLLKDGNGNVTGQFIHPKHSKKQYDEFVAKYGGTAMHDFLEYFVKEYDRLNRYLPASYKMDNKVPSIQKGFWDKMSTSESKLDMIKDSSTKLFMRTNTDISSGEMTNDAGEVMRQVPIHFTQSYDSATFKKYKNQLLSEGVGESAATQKATEMAVAEFPKYLSYDLGSSLQAFQHMAENYRDMSEISDIADAAKKMIGDRSVIKTDSTGQNILSRMKGLDNENISIRGTESKAYQLVDTLIETQIYGMTEKDLGSINVLGAEFDSKKLAKLLSKYNSMNMLGGNVLAATSNIFMGETMQWAEAFGGEYYSKKDYLAAMGDYTKNMAGIAADATNRTPKNIVNLINQHYDVLGDYHPDGAGSKDASIMRKAIGGGALFFLNSAGEHMMQSRAMIATMRKMKVYTKDGKPAGNLFEAHKVEDGKLVMDDIYVKNKDGEIVEFGSEQQRDLSRNVQYMLRKMHGNYNSQTAAAWQRNAVYGLIGQFRKWVAEGYDRRFAKERYSEFADKNVVGNYTSFGKFVAGLVKDAAQMNFDVAASWDKMNETQKANVKKTSFELGVLVGTGVALGVLAQMASGMDEEKDANKLRAIRYSLYITNRLNTELLFFVNPMDTWQILKSPAASMSVVQSAATTLNYALPWNWDEKYEAGINKDKSKLLHNFTKLVPLWKQLDRISVDGIKGQLQYHNIN